MCGIAGIWGSTTDDDREMLGRMVARLEHRGPDAEGGIATSRGALGHRRLAIMDPEGGEQPMRAGTSRAIVANGEIYNHASIRRRLGYRYPFRTGSDIEAALHLYDAEGAEIAPELDGMFAFAIADDAALYVARDPIGIKPLYFSELDGRWLFASELKAFPPSVSRVEEFPPGSWFHSERGFRRYYELPRHAPPPPDELSLGRTASRVRATLEKAVLKRLMSDVPLGAFLSGGLDSGLIVAIARRYLSPLHTFSVGFEGSPDLEAARELARHLGTIHHEYVLQEEEIVAELPRILYHLESYDPDLVRSAIPSYFTARLASEHVKVVLTGEGADELFAGYEYYKRYRSEQVLHEELRRSIGAMHNVNLQRVDRMTMAHGVEGRVPFLDREMIELALEIPPALKLHPGLGSNAMEKWILRKACEGLLPPDVVWRPKAQFDEGSGTAERIASVLNRYRDGSVAEEPVYREIFEREFDNPALVSDQVVRWADEARRL